MNVDRRNIFRSKWSDPCSKREDWFFWNVVNDNTCWANKLWSGIIIVFNLKEFFRRWECGQSFSKSIFIVGLNSIVRRENWPGHFIGSVIISFLIGWCGNVGSRCHWLLNLSGFSLLRILVWSFIKMSETMSHCGWNKKYT